MAPKPCPVARCVPRQKTKAHESTAVKDVVTGIQARSEIASRKGERTRRRILAATLEVLATRGIDGLTHRTIARRAGVSLAATTYHFCCIDDILVNAFDLITQDWNEALEATLVTSIEALTDSGLSPESSVADREALRDKLAAILADYLQNPSSERRVMLAAEMRLFHEVEHVFALREKLDIFRAEVISKIRVLPEKAGSDSPDLDASILFDAIRAMQFRALARPSEASRLNMLARSRRYFDWLLIC